MANSLGTLTSTLITDIVLEAALARLAPLMAFSRDFSAEAVKYGQTVNARYVTPAAVADYSTTDGYVAGDATTSNVNVTMNKHKHVTIAFNDQELSGTGRNLLEEQARTNAYQLADQVIDDALALVVAATYTNTAITETAANTDRDTLGALRQSLTNAKAPDFGRSVLMNVAAFGYLTSDAKIISSDYNDRGNVDMVSGRLRNVMGFENVFEVPNLPSTGNMQSFACTRSALVIATRLPEDPGVTSSAPIPGSIRVVQDPDTGLALQVREWYDMKLGKLSQTYTLMYGVAAARTEFLTICKTA